MTKQNAVINFNTIDIGWFCGQKQIAPINGIRKKKLHYAMRIQNRFKASLIINQRLIERMYIVYKSIWMDQSNKNPYNYWMNLYPNASAGRMKYAIEILSHFVSATPKTRSIEMSVNFSLCSIHIQVTNEFRTNDWRQRIKIICYCIRYFSHK